jgi:tetratricopeptide (TPR) repeat protein
MEDSYFDLFEDYYFGKLNPDELLDFKKRLDAESDLKKAFRKYQLAVKTAKLNDPRREVVKASKVNVSASDLNMDSEKSKADATDTTESKRIPIYKSKRFRYLMTSAAVIAVLMIGSRYFFPSSIDRDMIYSDLDISLQSQQISQDIVENRVKAFADTSRQMYYEGLDNFSNNRFAIAIQNLETYISSDSKLSKDTAYYFLGESYRAVGDLKTAIPVFNKIPDLSDLHNNKEISLMLCYLKIENDANALIAAKKILTSSDTLFHDQAGRLVDALK